MRMVPFKPEYDVCIGGSDLDEMIQAALDARSVAEALEGLEFYAPAASPSPGVDVSRVVTFVVDQSGSQRGRPVNDTLIFLDEAARVLEEQGIAFEVIGHTTPDWKGGRTYKAFMAEGKPYPESKTFWRLNEALVMVHKSVGESWQEEGRPRFKATAVDHMRFHHENFDQVALQEAATRLDDLDAGERTVVLLGDMCPNDEATQRHADGGSILSDLARVVDDVQSRGTRIFGVDVTNHPAPGGPEEAAKALSIPVTALPLFERRNGLTGEDHAAAVRAFAGEFLSGMSSAPAPAP